MRDRRGRISVLRERRRPLNRTASVASSIRPRRTIRLIFASGSSSISRSVSTRSNMVPRATRSTGRGFVAVFDARLIMFSVRTSTIRVSLLAKSCWLCGDR